MFFEPTNKAGHTQVLATKIISWEIFQIHSKCTFQLMLDEYHIKDINTEVPIDPESSVLFLVIIIQIWRP